VSTGPLITEAAGGEESVAKNEEAVDDLDTGLGVAEPCEDHSMWCPQDS